MGLFKKGGGVGEYRSFHHGIQVGPNCTGVQFNRWAKVYSNVKVMGGLGKTSKVHKVGAGHGWTTSGSLPTTG